MASRGGGAGSHEGCSRSTRRVLSRYLPGYYSLRRLAGEIDFLPPTLGAHREARQIGTQTYTLTRAFETARWMLFMTTRMLFMAA